MKRRSRISLSILLATVFAITASAQKKDKEDAGMKKEEEEKKKVDEAVQEA